MAIQLIFVVETNRQCGSDDIYIRSAINRFYCQRVTINLSPTAVHIGWIGR